MVLYFAVRYRNTETYVYDHLVNFNRVKGRTEKSIGDIQEPVSSCRNLYAFA